MSKYYEIYKQNLLTDEDNKTSKTVLDKIMLNIDKELEQKDQRIAELERENEKLEYAYDHMCIVEEKLKNKIKLLKEKGIE